MKKYLREVRQASFGEAGQQKEWPPVAKRGNDELLAGDSISKSE